MRRKSTILTNSELEIMKMVWERGSATVGVIYETLLARRRIAYTTVMTTMKILEGKGYLKRRTVNRAYVYEPAQPKSEVLKAMVSDFVNRAFGGSIKLLVMELIEDHRLSHKDLARIAAAIHKNR
jgi:BlaI family transcriptional regulator, penicillinase repressor